MPVKVAIQGQPASFHAIAASKFFGDEIELVCRGTFDQTFAAVVGSDADYGIAAIENSLFGSINSVYDLLLKHKLWISGEIYLRIEQCLIGLPGAQISGLKEVHSHPVALAQCEEFLGGKLPGVTRFEDYDTAQSAINVKKWGDPSKAAIASREAAKLYGLEVLVPEIETNKENYTRFVVLKRQKSIESNSDKSSLVMVTGNKPGALYQALGTFAKRDMNLTKLQSRPVIGKAWHYMFYVDVNEPADSSKFTEAMDELRKQGCQVSLLGSYKAGNKP